MVLFTIDSFCQEREVKKNCVLPQRSVTQATTAGLQCGQSLRQTAAHAAGRAHT